MMNKLFNHLLYFMNITDLGVEIEYDTEDHHILLSKETWRDLIYISRRDNEIKILNESFYMDKETELKDIVLWIYYQIYQYEQKLKIYQFLKNIQEHYQGELRIHIDDEKNIIKIENIVLRINDEGDIYSDLNEEDLPISNISYDIEETIEWIDMNLYEEVSLHE